MVDTLEQDSEAYADGWDDVDRRQIFAIEDPEATIRFEPDADQVILATLPTVTMRTVGEQPGQFELGERLGMGGMGEVRLARQSALQRDVAIKVVRSGTPTTRPSRILLREALVMGHLEHPNIVPIHVVGRDEEGELVVAMKRIEGETLQERIDSGYRLQDLNENIEILMQVCNATEFAHQRGIVHLDIKPNNVMIGSFGEVYLLDWGTAVAFRGDVPDTIPRPADDGRIRGTPAYMAPEMVVADPPTIATDVFLLGGLLHAMLTGEGPNTGEDPEAVLECAYHSEPRALPNAVPRELCAIVHKALARRPSERFLSAAALRRALSDYLASETARELLRSARRTREKFDAAIATNDADDAQVYASFGAARQLLLDAQQAASDPSSANDELQSLVESMCEWELARGNPAGAKSALHDIPRANVALEDRVASALAAKLREGEELAELRRQIDPAVANKQKILLWSLIGVVIAAIYVTPALFGYRQLPSEALVGHVGYLAALALVTLALRHRLFETRTNREVIGLIWTLSVFGLFVRVAAYAGSIELGNAIGLDLALVATMSVFGGWTIDRRVLASTVWYAIGALACFVYPQEAGPIFGLAHGIGLASIAVAHAAFKRG